MLFEQSCGAVLFTRADGTIKYVLAQSLDGDYGFPKGHMEAGETPRETALREIWEEVHIRPQIIDGFTAKDTYLLPRKRNVKKQVVLFLAEYEAQEIIIQADELRSAPLVDFHDAMKLLRHESLRKILKDANDFLSEQ